MDNSFERPSPARPTAMGELRQSVHSDLQYVSLQVDGRTYGGWYRLLADGRIELLALANMHSERRSEDTPAEQARCMLADFIRAAEPKPGTNGSAAGNAHAGSNAPAGNDRPDSTPGTLGALLYADRSKVRISEKDWLELVHSIAAGDQLALHRLFERTHRVVFTLIMRLTHDREAAEELTLDVFQEVWRRAPDYDPAAGSVLGWIANQARSRAIDRPDQPRGRAESGLLLRNALPALTPDERQMIETVFFSELAHPMLATELREPPTAVRKRLHAGLQKLQQSLAAGTGNV